MLLKTILLFSFLIYPNFLHPSWASSHFTDSFGDGDLQFEPQFLEPIKNLSVHSGREAILSCIVTNLGKYKLGWIRAEDQTILTIDTKVVTHNQRVGLTYDGVQTWNLHLRNVKKSDYGCYVCQLNTVVMKKQIGCIDVQVSPQIIDQETSGDITVREGENATLACRATGHPKPKIAWRREDGQNIILRVGMREVYKAYENGVNGEVLPFLRLDRRQMGTFLCIAANEVPPAVSKRITLDVNFPPLVKVPNQLMGAPIGTDVILECLVESCPRAFTYWIKGSQMIIDAGLGNKSSKFFLEEKRVSYKLYMRLTIRNFSQKDIDIYHCKATNSLGKAEGSVRLQEVKMAKTTSTSTENQVITMPGVYSGSGGESRKNRNGLWTTFGMTPGEREKIYSRDDLKSEIGIKKERQEPGEEFESSSVSNLIASNKFFLSINYLFSSFLTFYLFLAQNIFIR